MSNLKSSFHTLLTKTLQTKHPIVLAPMCGMATGELAGSVANSGGVGLIGIGVEGMFDLEWIEKEAVTAKKLAGKNGVGALGFGFIGCFMKEDDLAYAKSLELEPDVIYLGYCADYGTLIEKAHNFGIKVICQVHSVEEATDAVKGGADIIVLQGCDAGGHGKQHLSQSVISLIPQARDVLGPEIPLLAAGGIADGRGMAAALTLGADGVVMGSRFVVTQESKAHPAFKDRILKASATEEDTIVSSSFDILSGIDWPIEFRQGRAIKDSRTIEQFHRPIGSEQIMPSSTDMDWYKQNGYDVRAVWASSSSGLINTELSASQVVVETIDQAKEAIGRYS